MIKGINQNNHPEATSSDYAWWAKNAVFSRKLDAIINEPGLKLDPFTLPSQLLNGGWKIGLTTLGSDIILFYKGYYGGVSYKDCIAVLNEETGAVNVSVERTDLNFDIEHPISAVAKYNAKGELIVAFTDGQETPKYINLTTADPTDALNYYQLFPVNYNADNIVTSIQNSGNVLTGAYWIAFQYINKDGSRSSWSVTSNPTYVTTHRTSTTANLGQSISSAAGVGADKTIDIVLTNLDTSYSKVAIAVISRIKGVVAAKIVKEIAITQSNLNTFYNGAEFVSDVLLEEILATSVKYSTVKILEVLEDQLFGAELTADPPIDFQTIANATEIRWVSRYNDDGQGDLNAYTKYKDGNKKTFAHDEVYAFYIQFELVKDGSLTSWFHIPGRTSLSGELNDCSMSERTFWGSSLKGGNGGNLRVFEAKDTCILLSYLSGDFFGGVAEGRMSYWQNNDEVYPIGFGGGLDGTPVRHHKFPSIQYLNTIWDDHYGVDMLDTLGIKIINSSIDYNVVKGFRIGYAKRTLGDCSVLGMGLSMGAGLFETGPSTLIGTTGGNFSIDSLNGVGDNISYTPNYLRFNSFDIWQDRPSLVNAYVRNYLQLTTNDLGALTLYNDYGWRGSNVNGGYYTLISNFTKFAKITKTDLLPSNANALKALTSINYIPNNTKIDISGYTVENRGSEEVVFAKYQIPPTDLVSGGVLATSSNPAIPAFSLAVEETTFLSALKVIKSNFYANFDSREIVANPTIFRDQLSSHTLEYTGDCFIGIGSYATLAPLNQNAIESTTEMVVNFKVHVQSGRHNPSNRYITLGDYSTYFFPDAGLFDNVNQNSSWFYLNPRTARWNNFQYDKDFSATNDFNVAKVFTSEDLNNTSDYLFRIIRSTKASRENALEDGWRTFKALDYFDTVRNKGPIINLQAWGTDSLIIHHKYGFFKTRDKAVLQTNLINVTLGSGDIFAIEPKEEQATRTGTGGTQHRYSCLLTPIGYFSVDAEVGKIYLYDGSNLRDVGKGFTNIFLDHLRNPTRDNPFNFDGITLVYDQDYNRLILTQKENSYPATPEAEAIVGAPTGIINRHSFTASFDLDRGEWVSAHDYIPDYIFNTRTSLYSFKGNRLLKHNKIYDPLGVDPENRGEFYNAEPPYTSQIFPFFVDFIVNDGNKEEKILSTIQWLSKAINNTVVDNKGIYQRKTITAVTVWNDQHCTNKITVVTNEYESVFVDANCKIVDEKWEFNDLFDNVIDPSIPFVDKRLNDYRPLPANMAPPVWYDSEPLRGKYFIVRLEYDNVDGKEVHLRELIPSIRKSES